MITVSEKAANRIKEIRASKGFSEETPLRVGVAGGGCSGLTYQLDFDEAGADPDKKDQSFQHEDITIIVDMRSFLYLAGTQLDYSDGLKGQGFHFSNPNAARTCSCGESFAV